MPDRYSAPQSKSPIRSYSPSSSSSSPHSPLSLSPKSTTNRVPSVDSITLQAPDIYTSIPNQIIAYSQSGELAIALGTTVYLYYNDQHRVLFKGKTVIQALCWWGRDLVISGSGNIELWDTENRRAIFMFESHKGTATALAAYKDWFATGGDDGVIYVYQRDASQMIKIPLPDTKIFALTWSKEGDYLICLDSKKRALIYDNSFYQVGSIQFPEVVIAVTVLPGDYIVIGDTSQDGVMRMYSIRTGVELRTVCTGSPITSIIWDDNWGLFVSSLRFQPTWALWSKDFRKIAEFSCHENDILTMTYCSKTQQLASISSDETLQISTLKDNSPYHRISSPFRTGYNLR